MYEQIDKPKKKPKQKKTVFRFSEDLFPAAFIHYYSLRNEKVKGDIPASGKTMFKWHKVQFHHISVAGNRVDYLLHNGIVISSFPIGTKRDLIYTFLDRHWTERIFPFTIYIDKRIEDENI